MDVRKEMTRSIFLSGGVTMLPGFAERLYAEVDKVTPKTLQPKVGFDENDEISLITYVLFAGACIAVQIPRSLHWRMCAGQLTWSGPNENHQVRVANQRCQGTYEMDSVNFIQPDDGCRIFLMHLSSLLQRCIGVILIRIHFCIIVLIFIQVATIFCLTLVFVILSIHHVI